MGSYALFSPLGTAIVVALIAWVVGLSADLTLLNPQRTLIASTLLLLTYLAIESYRLRSASPSRWLLTPVVLCSVLTFVAGFGITNVLYFLPEDILTASGQGAEVTSWMSKIMLLALVAALAMWLGYWSPLAAASAKWLSKRRSLDRVLRRDFDPRSGVLLLFVILSLVSRLIQIRMGVYGYSADYGRLIETASVRQYLSLVEGLGKLALIISALRYYSPNPTARATAWLALLLVYEISFGFLSGFKSQVAMPVVIVGVCKYLRVGRIPWRWIAMLFVALVAAYAVIEPFRAARHEETGFHGTSLINIGETLVVAAATEPEVLDSQKAGTALQILSRSTMTYIASLGIEFADSRPLPAGSPAFLGDIFLAPIYAVIPRALWESKEMSRHGTWYRTEVMGSEGDDTTSIGMSPLTYLYFAGGGIAVGLGFFALGMVQRAWTERFLEPRAAGALLVYLTALPLLSIPDSAFFTVIVDFIRFVPAALILQYLIYRR